MDFRGLNVCIEPASWPLPNIKGLFERIGNCKPEILGVMDLTSGYHQAPIHPDHRIYTAFLCFAGIYHLTRLPFGPKRAPSYFQEQMVSKVLQGLLYVSCEMYLGDCIVCAFSEDQFVERQREVLQRFKDRGLLLKAKKCRFGMASIEYVGRVVSKDGLSMSAPKIENVLNFPRPRTMTALRSLLGLANYFRGFVPYHSDIVRPLQNMIDHKARKKEAPIWTPAGVEAFHAIKLVISKCPLMYFLDDDSPIRLYTDASDYGIGGVLYQVVG